MSLSDPIADMLTRIRNASMAGLDTVEVPRSNLKSEIARVMKREGFIKDYTTEGQGGKKILRLYLKYAADRSPVIQGLCRKSKPSLRAYVSVENIPSVLRGIGIAILSTSSGILTDKEASKARVGGEVLCYVW